jgi:hypothetical protein
MDNFNNQFATQRLREEDYTIDEISEIDEMSVTGAGANFISGKGEQYAPTKAFEKTIEEETSDQFIVNKVWDFLESRPFYNKEYMPKFSTAEEIYNEFGPKELKMYSDFDWKGNTEPIHPREKAALHRIGIMDKKSIQEKDVEPKLAAGKAKVYMKDKWDWKEAPSIPNRPSKGGFIYKQLFQELMKTPIQEVSSFYFAEPITDLDDSQIESAKSEAKKLIQRLKNEKYIVLGSNALYFPNFTWAVGKQEFGPSIGVLVGSETIAVSPISGEYAGKVYKIGESFISRLIKSKDLTAYTIIMNDEENINEDSLEEAQVPSNIKKWATQRGISSAAALHLKPKEAPSIPVNENYSKFKTETKTKTNEQQFHSAVRLAEKKIREANKILEYTAQLRSELNEVKTNKMTLRIMERMTKGIAEAYGKMKKLK